MKSVLPLICFRCAALHKLKLIRVSKKTTGELSAGAGVSHFVVMEDHKKSHPHELSSGF
jgi:hypothetical protein